MVAVSAVPGTHADDALQAILGQLVRAGVDLRDLCADVARVAETEREGDPVARRATIRSLVHERGGFIEYQFGQLADAMLDVRRQQDGLRSSRDQEAIEAIQNGWDEIIASGDAAHLLDTARSTDPNVTVKLARVRRLARRLRALRGAIGAFVVPFGVRDEVRRLSGVGAELDFHEAYRDQLEDPDDRVRVLGRLAQLDVDAVGGMVELERGVILRVGPRPRRWLSYGLMGLGALAGLLVVYVCSLGLLNLPGMGPGGRSFDQLLPYYLLVMVGVAAHIVKKAAELSRMQRARQGDWGDVVLDRLPLWVHVREYRFLSSIGVAVLAFIGLVTSNQLTVTSALLAGYTIDSLSDLLLERFSSKVATYGQDVRRVLSATG